MTQRLRWSSKPVALHWLDDQDDQDDQQAIR